MSSRSVSSTRSVAVLDSLATDERGPGMHDSSSLGSEVTGRPGGGGR